MRDASAGFVQIPLAGPFEHGRIVSEPSDVPQAVPCGL
jgi:hypothetical protein